MQKIIITILSIGCTLGVLAQPDVEMEWAKSLGSNNYDLSASIAVDDSGNVFTVGSFLGTIDFDPGPGAHVLTTEESSDIYIHKLDKWGNFQWVRQIIGNGNSDAISIVVDGSGNLIITGNFRSTMDFDPGPGISVLTTQVNQSQAYLLKLNPLGEFIWVKHIAGYSVYVEEMELDASGNMYLYGRFRGTVDLDPGPGTFNITATGSLGVNSGLFFEKLDSVGNFLWGEQILEGGSAKVQIFDIDHLGNIILTGWVSNYQTDFDPGPNTYSIGTTGGEEVFILKLDSGGNFVWAKHMGGNGPVPQNRSEGLGISVDDSANIYTTGMFRYPTDFDPGPNVFTLTPSPPSFSSDIFIQKLDPDGNFVWAKSMGGNWNDKGEFLILDSLNYLYVVGSFSSDSVDLDPGPATYLLHLEGEYSMFAQKLDLNGNFVWAKQLGGTGSLTASSVALSRSNELYFSGPFNEVVDFDPGVDTFELQAVAFSDIFITKWRPNNTSNLTIVFEGDSVSNISCIDSGQISVHAINGHPPYNYVWDVIPPVHDSILLVETSGIYSVTVTDSLGYYRTASVIVDAPPTHQAAFDLNANLIASNFRTGFLSNVWLDAFNNGCLPATGQLCFVVSPLVQYNGATPSPDLISGDTLIWNFANLTFDSGYINPWILLTPTAISGEACFQLIIKPINGDVNPANNIKNYCFDILNSFDPNDKQVHPAGPCEENHILPDQLLTYTLRFQNTGNADAINIYLIDSLDTNLDLKSVKIVGKSHKPMITEVLPGNVLKFRFNNIHLPDSTSNEAASHGYVIFEVRPRPDLPAGTIIENQVGIYFDFNEPVLTNTVVNTVVDTLPANRAFDISVEQNGIILTAQTTGTGTAYQWIDCDTGLSIPDATSIHFTPKVNGNYAVRVTRSSCSVTSACYHVSNVGDEHLAIPGLYSYPNPSTGQLTIGLGQIYHQIKIEVIDMIGRSIGSHRFTDQEKVDLKLPEESGVYLVRVWVDGNEAMVKVVRE